VSAQSGLGNKKSHRSGQGHMSDRETFCDGGRVAIPAAYS
jgi:hypothetical protein